MKYSFYPGGFLLVTNITIAKIMFFLEFMKSYHSWSSNSLFTHHIQCTSQHNLAKMLCEGRIVLQIQASGNCGTRTPSMLFFKDLADMKTLTDNMYQMKQIPSWKIITSPYKFHLLQFHSFDIYGDLNLVY